MITLQELLDSVYAAPRSNPVKMPTARAVSRSGSEIVESLMTYDGSLLLVYQNGYVVYHTGRRRTVFHLSDLSDGYSYSTVGIWNRKDMFIPMEDLLQMPWYFAVLMVAEDRVSSNIYTGDRILGARQAALYKGQDEIWMPKHL